MGRECNYPVGNATGQERHTPRARALALSFVCRGAAGTETVADNLYECALCGACVKECVTGWDPVAFTIAARTELALTGFLPGYILALIDNFENYGTIFNKGADDLLPFDERETDTLLYMGETARHRNPGPVWDVPALLNKAGVDFTLLKDEQPSGYSLFFLTGKTRETKAQAEKCAALINGYKTVIVYDPADYKLMIREYKELGIEITARIVSWNTFLLDLIDCGKLKVKNNGNEYTVQDNFNYSRELGDVSTVRSLMAKIGKSKEMLLSGKDTTYAGSLIMNEYMPDTMREIALCRWQNAINAGAKTLVTQSPDENALLKKTVPEGCRVLSIEQSVTENL